MPIDEHRPFKSCIFCGSTAKRTKEHIFGKAVARRFPVKHRWKASGKDLLGPLLAQGGGPIISATAKLACGVCNNGPLKKDMDKSLEPLMRLIEGTPHQITAQDRASLSRYWERVGLIVDAMTSNYQITATYAAGEEYALSKEYRQLPPLYSEAEREEWIKGGALLDMHIYIGFHDGVLGLNPGTDIAHVSARVPIQGVITTEVQLPVEKRFLMTIGKLSVCIWMGKDHLHIPIPLRPSFIGNSPPIPTSFRNLAIANQTWDWPGAIPPASYLDILSLYNQTPDVRLIIQEMSDPTERQQFGDFMRQIPPDIK